MIDALIVVLRWLEQILVLLVLVKIILSYFMSPYHPLRVALDKIVEPLLAPIRRVVPLVGMFDFSPLILIILVQLIVSLLIGILSRL
jgi:YggT family protein